MVDFLTHNTKVGVLSLFRRFQRLAAPRHAIRPV
jgi:hypothetical protein